MLWREDVAPTRAGDAEARERLREYFTPFAHGVALSYAPHHVTDRLVPHILDQALATLGGVDDEGVGVHVMNVARRLAKEAQPGAIDELASPTPSLSEARQSIARLRAVPETLREKLFLRLVEGVPGPELAEVLRASPAELRAELERAAGEAARAVGQAQSFAGDDYLWELTGTPPALLARLEMQLPVLRFDPLAPPPPEPSVAGTLQDLQPVGSVAPPRAKSSMYEEHEGTETGIATRPVPKAKPAPPPPLQIDRSLLEQANPFEGQARTIAATDLPAEARGTLPAPSVSAPSSSSKSGKQAPLPARPVPSVSSDPERSGKSGSGKSNSNKSGKQVPVEGSKSGRMTQLPPRDVSSPKLIDPTKEGPKLGDEPLPTEAKVPALILAKQQADITTTPESEMLGKPTMQMPMSVAVQASREQVITSMETRVAAAATAPVPRPTLADSPAFKGTQPFFIAGILITIGLVAYSVSLFTVDRNARASWQLAQVVVAAEDLGVGDTITLENVALRAVPEPFQGSGVVRGEMMNTILDQKLAVAVQMGDPLFLQQLASVRLADQRLSKKVQKRTRGFTVSTTAVQAVGRWVRPGDLVDVLVSFPMKEQGKRKIERRAVTLLQKVPVIATGKIADTLSEATADDRDKSYGNVTVLLTPEEAEALTLAATLGKVKLTLRNDEDLEDDRNLQDAYTDSDTLLDGERRRVLRARRNQIIQIIRNQAPTERDPKKPK